MSSFELLKFLGASIGALLAVLYYAAHLVDHSLNQEGKADLFKFASRRALLPAVRVAFKFFLYASDRFFGDKILSLKAFFRSAVLTVGWSAIVLGICYTRYPNYESWLWRPATKQLILQSLLPLVFAAIIADYLSVCLTRRIIRESTGRRAINPFFAVAIDLVLSVLLFYQ